jgi:hypothetical protein
MSGIFKANAYKKPVSILKSGGAGGKVLENFRNQLDT